MLELLKNHDIKWWTTDFLNTLNSAYPINQPQHLDENTKQTLIDLYKKANKRTFNFRLRWHIGTF